MRYWLLAIELLDISITDHLKYVWLLKLRPNQNVSPFFSFVCIEKVNEDFQGLVALLKNCICWRSYFCLLTANCKISATAFVQQGQSFPLVGPYLIKFLTMFQRFSIFPSLVVLLITHHSLIPSSILIGTQSTFKVP